MLVALSSLSILINGCNTKDDVIEIFAGKTWKLSRLTNKDSNAQFYPGLWNYDDEAMKRSLNSLYNQKNSFTLNFEGSELDGKLMGTTISGQGINATFDGTWDADGKTGSLTIRVKTTDAENDALVRAFVNGLQNVYKYEGDANSLTLFYKDGNITRVMGFSHKR